jgi:EmrB/QacA subfamily drug resistance transporter
MSKPWRTLVITSVGVFMASLDLFIVNIAFPDIAASFDNAKLSDLSWVLNAYAIVFAALLVPFGRIADRVGRKRIFLYGLLVFTAGSALSVAEPSVGALVGARVIQATGGAMMIPTSLGLILAVFPAEKRAAAVGAWSAAAGVAAALGPPIGGLLVEFAGWPFSVGWHWIFLINVPLGILGIVLALRVMPETTDPEAGTDVDWWGMTTIGGSVFCLTYGLVEANKKGWGSPLIVSLFVASALLAVAFALTQRFGKYPMLTKGLVRNRQFMGASTSLFLFAIGMMGVLFMTVLAFVNLWGYSELTAALAISPVPLVGLLVSPLVGRASTHVQPRVVGVPALIVMAGGLYWLSQFPAEPHYASVVGPLILMGAGMGATFPAVSIGSMGSISGQELGLGSGIVNMARQVGFAVGVALLVAVFTGTIKTEIKQARKEVTVVAAQARLTPAETAQLDRAAFFNPQDPSAGTQLAPRTPVQHKARRIVDEHVRNAYGDAIGVAAFVTLLGIPFSLTMRRRPGEAVSPEMAAAAAAAAG